jgi:hypothetical protein
MPEYFLFVLTFQSLDVHWIQLALNSENAVKQRSCLVIKSLARIVLPLDKMVSLQVLHIEQYP